MVVGTPEDLVLLDDHFSRESAHQGKLGGADGPSVGMVGQRRGGGLLRGRRSGHRRQQIEQTVSGGVGVRDAAALVASEDALDHVVEHRVQLGGAAGRHGEQLLAVGAVAADPLRRRLEPVDHLVGADGEIADLVAVEDGYPAELVDVFAADDLGNDPADALQGAGDRAGEKNGAHGRPGGGHQREEEEVEDLRAVVAPGRAGDHQRHVARPRDRAIAGGALARGIENGTGVLSRQLARETEAQRGSGEKLASGLGVVANGTVPARDRREIERRTGAVGRGRLRDRIGEPLRACREIPLPRPHLGHVRGQGQPDRGRRDQRE